MKVFVSFLALFLVARTQAYNEPLVQSAEKSFLQNNFVEALELWKKVYKINPNSVEAVTRVSALQLFLEGHEVAQKTILEFINDKKEFLNFSQADFLRKRLLETQARFIKDESQSLYLQALAKIKLSNCAQALPLLNQANQIEKANSRILEWKAMCEREVGQFNHYYDTLKTAAEFTWIETKNQDDLIEAQYFFQDFSDINSWAQSQLGPSLSPRQKVAIAMATVEKNESLETSQRLFQLIETTKDKDLPAVVWFGLGRCYRKQGQFALAVRYFERFISLASKSQSLTTNGWDPYRTAEKLEDAKQWLLEAKQGQ